MLDCFQQSFQQSFGKKVIIDCVLKYSLKNPLIFKLEHPRGRITNIKNRILPQGVVGFSSEARGGRVNDNYLTEHCGILRKLLPQDIVLADRGFDIAEFVVRSVQAKLHIPAFTKGKKQFTSLGSGGNKNSQCEDSCGACNWCCSPAKPNFAEYSAHSLHNEKK